MSENRGVVWSWTSEEGIKLIAEAFGESNLEPIIFVHGGGQSRHSWRRGAQATAAAGYWAITVDLRGHGDSGWSPDGEYSPGAFASDLQCLMRLLTRPPILVGASRGGYATLVAAARSAPPARALVLVEIAPRIDHGGAAQVRHFMRASAGGFDDPGQAADLLSRYMKRSAPKSLSRLRRSMRKENGRWYWRWDPKVALGDLHDAEPVERELEAAARALACPLLLVRGEQSELVKRQHVAHLLDLTPHASVVTIKGSGHMVSGDANDAFNAAIVDFISNLPPVRGDSLKPELGDDLMNNLRVDVQ